jgi:hypothetical protein
MDSLYVFDFDDTLAKTEGEIGVSFKLKGQRWEGAKDFLDQLGASYTTSYDYERMDEVFYLPSDDYARAESEFKSLEAQGIRHFEDFSNFAKVADYELKPRIMQWLKLAKADPANGVCVLTARSGDGQNLRSLFKGIGQMSTNARDIHAILQKELGVNVPVFAVGTPGANIANEKRGTLAQLVRQHRPREVHMFDDSSRNLRTIEDLCGKINARLVTHKVAPGSDSIEGTSTCEAFLRLF